MEKIVFKLWRSDSDSLEKFKKSLLVDLPKTLESLISELQINIVDEDVNEAAALAQINYSQNPDAIVFTKVASQYYSETFVNFRWCLFVPSPSMLKMGSVHTGFPGSENVTRKFASQH